jgi:hypothetical protein
VSDLREYDSAVVTLVLEHGYTFKFEVQDWDIDDAPLTAEEAYTMAEGLVKDRVPLYGTLDGVDCLTVIPPERVIAHYVTGTGRR